MKRSTRNIIFSLVIIAAILGVCGYAIIHHASAPLAQRQDKTQYTPKQNVIIDADTFNGNIQIQPTTGSQIEVIYNVTAPDGYLSDIKTSTNETKTDTSTTIVTNAVLVSNEAGSGDYKASLRINVPTTSSYNLTLSTGNGNIIKPQINDGKVTATTSNGNVDIKDGGGSEIAAMSLNGNVNIGLKQGTLFQVAASVGNGKISHQGIQLNASTDSATRLLGNTTAGSGNLSLTLNSGNGNIAIQYLPP